MMRKEELDFCASLRGSRAEALVAEDKVGEARAAFHEAEGLAAEAQRILEEARTKEKEASQAAESLGGKSEG